MWTTAWGRLVRVLRGPGTARVLGLAAVALVALAAIIAARGVYQTRSLGHGIYVVTNRLMGASWWCERWGGCHPTDWAGVQ